MDLDTGLRLGFRVGVAADMRAPFYNKDTLAQLRRRALSDRQTEEAGTDDE
ncbi:hypothetical protein XA26_57960 [Mycolicibacterium fortuitum]|uniref:Uncharacterized protein n=1 Tax=Mycolicibacterium fortuitum TaxID=1766 RepID=A0A0N9XL57_MYCFO|nr:hypothetical protein XA26_57960 [Mycolicibacterium fortuitum]